MRQDRPSATALFIARSLVFWARGDSALTDTHSTALALAGLRAGGVDVRRWWRLCGIRWIRRVIWSCERLILPGIVLHYVLRKRAIAAAVDQALAQGCTAVVVLAAGFDALAWRLHRAHPRLVVLEVDHPATQAAKRRAFARTADQPTLVALDLGAGELQMTLPSGPTVVVAEGLLMYLPEERVVALLHNLSTRLARGSRVVFTCMTADRQGRLGFPAAHPLIDHWLRHQREVFSWGIPAERLPAFLARVGLRLLAHDEADGLARRFLPPGDRRRGAYGEAVLVTEPLQGGA